MDIFLPNPFFSTTAAVITLTAIILCLLNRDLKNRAKVIWILGILASGGLLGSLIYGLKYYKLPAQIIVTIVCCAFIYLQVLELSSGSNLSPGDSELSIWYSDDDFRIAMSLAERFFSGEEKDRLIRQIRTLDREFREVCSTKTVGYEDKHYKHYQLLWFSLNLALRDGLTQRDSKVWNEIFESRNTLSYGEIENSICYLREDERTRFSDVVFVREVIGQIEQLSNASQRRNLKGKMQEINNILCRSSVATNSETDLVIYLLTLFEDSLTDQEYIQWNALYDARKNLNREQRRILYLAKRAHFNANEK